MGQQSQNGQQQAEAEHAAEVARLRDLRRWLESDRVFEQLVKSCQGGEAMANRVLRVALTSVGQNSRLLECTQESILLALMEAGAVGLEPTGILGHAYLVPYWNKHLKRLEAQFQAGYKGLITLAMRHPDVLAIRADSVREGDEFDHCKGDRPRIDHVPDLDALDPDPATITHVYAVAWLRDAPFALGEVMSRAQVEAVRERSQSATKGPWVTDWEPMALKTVVRRLSTRSLPMESEYMGVVAKDDAIETGKGAVQLAAYVPHLALPAPSPESRLEQELSKRPESKAQGVKEAVRIRRQEREQAEAT